MVSERSFLLVLTAFWLSSECVVCWKVLAVFCVHHIPVNLGVHRCFLALDCFCKTTVNASSLKRVLLHSSTPSLNTFSRITTSYTSQETYSFLPLSWFPSRPIYFIISVCVLCVRLFAAPWTIAPPVSSVLGIFQARILEEFLLKPFLILNPFPSSGNCII